MYHGIIVRDNKGRIARIISTRQPEECPGCGELFTKKVNRQTYCTRQCSFTGAAKSRTGKRRSVEACNKIRLAKLGSKNPAWRGGVSSERLKQINTRQYRDWRAAVLARDNHTCVNCSAGDCRVDADHVIPWADNVTGRFDVSNGQTLCVPCHRAKTAAELRTHWRNQYTSAEAQVKGNRLDAAA